MRFRKAMVPSMFTLFNMFAGFLAIIEAYHGNYNLAIWLIFFAAVFDGLDGKLARLMNNTSEFGVEFDSLADVISFCAAPSFLIYRLYAVDLGIPGAMIAFFPLMFGSIRLARFNVQTTSAPIPYFVGLPTPVSALSIIAYPLFHLASGAGLGNAKIMLPYVVCLSFLMVSHVQYPKMPKVTLRGGAANTLRLLGLLGCVILLIIFPARALLGLTVLFNIAGIIRWMAGIENEENQELVNSLKS